MFVFDVDGKRDTLTDFQDGKDLIGLNGISYAALSFEDSNNGSVIIRYDGQAEMLLKDVGSTDLDEEVFADKEHERVAVRRRARS